MSNLYANRVFSEHPIALWSFDEKANYKSLISESDRELDAWATKTNLTASEYTSVEVSDIPFPDSYTTQAYPTNNAVTDCVFTSGTVWAGTDIYPNVPVSASIYIFLPEARVAYVDFGSTDGVDTDYTRHVMPTTGRRFWVKLTHNDLTYEQLYIKINFESGSLEEDTTWLFNGLSLGQYSEQTSSDSLGVETTEAETLDDLIYYTTLPDTVAWYHTQSIGSKEKDLYYIEQDKRLLAYNTAMPMVYGSNYLTKIIPSSDGSPSLVFDGDGYLCNTGKYDTYTLELWVRLGGLSPTPHKLFGNAGFTSGSNESNDGLWVTSSVLTYVVGNKEILSYNIGPISDPMLVHLTYTPTEISMLINGEIVASKLIEDVDSLTFAENGCYWLGFWGSDLLDVEIDCMSLFGYVVPELVARKRFVWGQGVNDVNAINSQYGGVGATADFAAAKTNSNAAYPLNFFWESGHLDNLTTKNNKLTVPSLSLPDTTLGTGTKAEWLADIDLNFPTEEVFSYVPSGTYTSATSYTTFGRLGDFIQNPVGLVITWENDSTADEPLAVISHPAYTSRTITLSTDDGDTLLLTYTDGSDSTTIHTSAYDNTAQQSTYINLLATLTSADATIPDGLRQILSNTNELKVVIGSDGTTTNTGKYFSIGIVSQSNFNLEIEDLLPTTTRIVSAIERAVDDEYSCFDLCSYSWLPKRQFGIFYEDIGIKGYWQDYISASQLAGIVTDYRGDQKLSLNNLQFNIGHPRPTALIPSPSGAWTYDEMTEYYSGTALALLYSGFFTGYVTYDDLATRTLTADDPDISLPLDTSDMFVRSFVSFQRNTSLVKQRSELGSTIPAYSGNVLYAQAYSDCLNKEFEVVDGTSIIPPININPANLLVAVYLEFSVPGINTYPVSVKSLEVSSHTLNQDTFTPIQTRSGKNVYPVINNGTYYDYGTVHPFKIDKRGYPYLYLGRETGFLSEADRFNTDWHKGFLLEVPEGVNSDYRLDNLQFWTRRNKQFPETEQKVFSFSYSVEEIYVTMQSYQDDKNRGILRAYNRDGTPNQTVTFYQNGNFVKNPILDKNQWAAINIAMPAGGLNLETSTGYIRLYQGLVFNNVSYFAVRTSLGATDVLYGQWSDVDDEIWSYWSSDIDADPNTWASILVLGKVSRKAKELSQIVYKTYIGTQVISMEGSTPLTFKQGEISNKKGVVWSTTTIIPS